MNNRLGFFLLLPVSVLLLTCKHEQETDPTPCDCGHVTTIDEIRDWAFFKEGTYWIYEEETTLARDTFTVVDSHDFITGQGNVQFDYETYRSSDGYYYWFWFNEGWTSSCALMDCCSCRTLWCDKYISGDADGEDRLLRFPTFSGNYAYQIFGGNEGGKIEVVSYLDSVTIGSMIFYDVAVEHVDNSVLDQSSDTDNWYESIYFFSHSIGIVRKEIQETNEIWNLIEFNIVQ